MKKTYTAKKKLTMLLLAAFMLLSLSAVACSSGDSDSSTPPPDTPTPATPAPAPDDSDGEEEGDTPEEDLRGIYGPYANDEHDFGGIEIVIFFPWDRTPPRGESIDWDRWWERLEYFQDKWNFTLTFNEVGWDNYISRCITTTMAGDPMGDLGYAITRDILPSFITSGIAYDLGSLDIFDKHVPEYEPILEPSAAFAGGVYAVTENFGFQHGGSHPNATGVYFNITMLNREGLPSPFDLYAEGNWTWDTLMDLAIRATQDLDGDGVIDQFGLSHRYSPHAFVDSNGGAIIWEQNGQYEFGLLEDSSLQALTFYSELNAQPIWQSGGNWDAPMTEFRDGRVAFTINQFWTVNSYFGEMADDWGWVPMPRRTGANHELTLFADEVGLMWAPSSAKHVREAAIVWEALTKDPLYDPADWAFTIENLVKNQETIDMFLHSAEEYSTRVDLFKGFGLEGDLGNAFGRIGTDATALSVMQEIEGVVYGKISDRVNADLESEAARNLIRAETQTLMARFYDEVITWDDDGNGTVLWDELEFTVDDVRAMVDEAQASIQASLDAGFTEDDIPGFWYYNDMMLVINALAELDG